MNQRSSTLLIGLTLAVLGWGAPPVRSESPKSAPSGRAAQVSAASVEIERRAATLSSFPGGRITVGDLEDVATNKLAAERRDLARPGQLAHLLDQLIRYDLLVLEAQRRGYSEHPLVIDAIKRATIDAMTRRDLALDETTIPAEEVSAFYEQHKAELSRPLLRRASHIELATETEARTLLAELTHADRPRFARLARERSLDTRTAHQGGELGYFDREGHASDPHVPATPRALVDAVYALKNVGDISQEPIHNGATFSLVMFTGEMPAMTKSLAKVAPRIRDQLAQERASRALDALLKRLMTEHPSELHPELLDSIVLDPAQPPEIPEGFPAAPPDPRAPPRRVKPDGI
jgi:peptidyl-prolyl cis-trans isomerase C